MTHRLLQTEEISLSHQSLEKKCYTNGTSIPEIRNITDSTITGEKKFSDERIITEQRDITHETKFSQKCLVTSQLLQK